MKKILTLVMTTLIFSACVAQESEETIYEGVEFEMPKVVIPTFPDYRVSIVDFGAIADGTTKNTQAIAEAISDVVKNGGGTVVIPRGIWVTGPVTLKSNLNLHLEDGALLLFTDDKDDYPLIGTSFEGLDTYRCLSPINGNGLENVAITGNGTIDGNGDAWRAVKKSKMSESQWKQLVKSGGMLSEDGKNWYPSESYRRGAEATSGFFNVPKTSSKEDFAQFKDFLRPVMVSIVNSKNVLLDGPTFQNSPAWNIHPLMCENVTIRNLNVRNPWYSQNGDGLDLESCKNALIYNNTFDVGDDAICIKSGKNEDGRKRGVPTANVIIKNNIVYHGHGGFVVGSEMSGGVKNIHVSKCTFMGTDTGLRFKSTRGRGGVVENIYISDIDMINIPTEPIRFNLFYGGQSPVLEDDQEAAVIDEEMMPVTEKTPSFKDIYMTNIRAVGCETAGYFQGLPEMNLKNINISNSNLEARKGINLIDADGVNFTNVSVKVEKGLPLTIYNGKNITLDGLSASSQSSKIKVKVMGAKTDKVVTKGLDKSEVEISSQVSKKATKIQ
ncbi:MAG: glycoside hydrolase [Flammeovirgaceae bacterium]|nr:glycoside hydrolase [Flammeovirgaceae bacterium]MBR06796.1 glycoside hydrolase [Rickettsiales bacterium]HCX24726.1 glycoside hydrolase [Cytophagales bacterium]|tara:strand:- start:180 stop:1841 length:1662 start_codon:yes stop_codon:yes gene_type:complete